MPSGLLDLPPELILCILCHLNLSSIVSLANAYPSICPIIEDFVSSNYRSATREAMVNDNPHCDLPILDRLAILRRRENGWAKLRVDLRRSIPISYDPSKVHHLESGHFVLSEVYSRGFYSCKLPSKPSDHTTWSHINVENFHDVVLSIDEHDLAAALIIPRYSARDPQPCQFDVKLLQFSTGNPHPLADSPTVTLGDSLPSAAIKSDICGDYIGIVCGNVDASPGSPIQDHVFIINWKTGMRRMHISASCGSYFDLTFLSSELILLPNARSMTLDIWRIPEMSSAPPTHPLLILNLPPSYEIWSPRILLSRDLSRTARNSNRPFHTSSADALIGIKIMASFMDPLIFVVVHRRALMALLPTHSTAVSNASGQHDGDDFVAPDTVILDSDLISGVPWAEWGPRVTRCFYIIDDGRFMEEETTIAGQRCIMGFPSNYAPSETEDAPTSFFILDFNPLTIKRALEGVLDSNQTYTACTSPNITVDVMCHCVFDSQLPFAFQRVHFSIHEFGYLLMDEDQIVEYARPITHCPPMLEVFHVGTEEDL